MDHSKAIGRGAPDNDARPKVGAPVFAGQRKGHVMKAALIFSGGGPLLILTSHEGLEDPALLDRLDSKGIRKFIAFPVPLDLVRNRYAAHFDVVCRDLHETDDLRVLDFDGRRAMELLPFSALGEPIFHEGAVKAVC